MKAVYHNDQLIGLLFADDIHENTVTFWYIAVLPEFRGRGYGNLLFAYGLNFLHSLGAKHHIGSTAVINQPMVKVFERNGCKKIMSRIEFIYMNPYC